MTKDEFALQAAKKSLEVIVSQDRDLPSLLNAITEVRTRALKILTYTEQEWTDLKESMVEAGFKV